jgi:hypothetical protein
VRVGAAGEWWAPSHYFEVRTRRDTFFPGRAQGNTGAPVEPVRAGSKTTTDASHASRRCSAGYRRHALAGRDARGFPIEREQQ